jgi:hypothetical protein
LLLQLFLLSLLLLLLLLRVLQVDASLLSAHQRLAINTISLIWFQGQASFQQALSSIQAARVSRLIST